MAFVHGKDTFVSLDSNDLSAFTNTSDFNRTADTHDTTTYGKSSHTFEPGLLNATASMGGTYDNGTTGPRDVIEPLIGTTVTFERRPEGTGSGLPSDSVSVVVNSYVETNPVAGMVSWTCGMQCSDDITSTNQ